MNPFIGAQPFYADIGYPQGQYQSPTQNLASQGAFQNAAMQQMQNLANAPLQKNTSSQKLDPMSLAMALRAMGVGQGGNDYLTQGANVSPDAVGNYNLGASNLPSGGSLGASYTGNWGYTPVGG